MSSLWPCANGHKTDGKYCSRHLVAVYMPFAFSLSTDVHDCLRSPRPAPDLFLSQSQGSGYPLFSLTPFPLEHVDFSKFKKKPHPKLSYQKKDSIANKMSPRVQRGRQGEISADLQFRRPSFWMYFPMPFQNPGKKCQQGNG